MNQNDKFKYYIDKICPLCFNNNTCNKDCFRGYKNMKGDTTIRCPNYSLDDNKRGKQEWKVKK